MRAVDPSLVFLAIATSEQVRAAETLGIRTVCEIYADRGYNEEGRQGLCRKHKIRWLLDRLLSQAMTSAVKQPC
jgi:lactam utilization protein B